MIDLTHNSITLNQTYPEVNDSFFIEGDVIIPDVKPDVDSVLFVDALPVINDYSVNSGQITFSGDCEFNILYVSNETPSEIIRISTSIPFKNTFAAKNLTSDSCVNLTITPQKVSSLILNGRKLSVSSELNANLKYSNQNNITYIESAGDNETIKVLNSTKTIPTFLGETSSKTTLKDTAMLPTDLPNIKDIIKYDSTVSNEENVISDGKIIIKADFNIKIYYTTDNSNEISIFETTIPFSTFIDINGINEDDFTEVINTIKNVGLKILPDSDELMRVIEVDTEIETNAKAFQNSDINVIEDIYDTTRNLLPQRDEIFYETNSPLQSEDISLRDSISIPEDEEIKILSSFARIKSLNLEKENNNNMLKGVIDVTILYSVPSSGRINSVTLDMPLEHVLSSDIDILSNASITSIEVTPNGQDKYDIKISMTISGYKNSSNQLSLLRDVIEMEELPLINSGITIYFVKPGDTLWKIAKRFYTTIDKLVKINNIQNPDVLDVGKALVIS